MIRVGNFFRWSILLTTACVGLASVSADEPIARSVSSSKQFTVESADQRLSVSLAAFAERVKAALLIKLQLPDRWHSPVFIAIVARKKASDAPALSVAPQAFGGRLQFILRAETPPALDQAEFFRALTQVLCAELVNRSRGSVRAGETLTVAPLWLSEGLWQSVADSTVQVPLHETNLLLLRRTVDAGRSTNWAQLAATTQRPRDAVAAQLFGAHSQVLVESLLALPNGRRKMQAFLATLPTVKHWQSAFIAAFVDDFPNEAALEKWWSLRVQTRAQQRIPQALSARETMRRLDGILPTNIIIANPKTGAQTTRTLRVTELGDYAQLSGLREQLDQKTAALVALQTAAHPTFREPIALYTDALQHLRQRAFNHYLKQAARADTAHQEAVRQAQDVSAYLNALEDKTPGLALSLRDFFMPAPETAPTTSPNPIGGFLDRIEDASTAP